MWYALFLLEFGSSTADGVVIYHVPNYAPFFSYNCLLVSEVYVVGPSYDVVTKKTDRKEEAMILKGKKKRPIPVLSLKNNSFFLRGKVGLVRKGAREGYSLAAGIASTVFNAWHGGEK